MYKKAVFTLFTLFVSASYAGSPDVQLTNHVWEKLCPKGQTLSNGCLPNCQDPKGQKAACTTILSRTGLENLMGITETNSAGMYVISLTPTRNSIAEAPVFDNRNNANNISCAIFTASGAIVPMPITAPTVLNGDAGAATVSTTGTPIVVAANIFYAPAHPLFATGALPANTTYYVVCLGYLVNGRTANNVPASGTIVGWPEIL